MLIAGIFLMFGGVVIGALVWHRSRSGPMVGEILALPLVAGMATFTAGAMLTVIGVLQ